MPPGHTLLILAICFGVERFFACLKFGCFRLEGGDSTNIDALLILQQQEQQQQRQHRRRSTTTITNTVDGRNLANHLGCMKRL